MDSGRSRRMGGYVAVAAVCAAAIGACMLVQVRSNCAHRQVSAWDSNGSFGGGKGGKGGSLGQGMGVGGGRRSQRERHLTIVCLGILRDVRVPRTRDLPKDQLETLTASPPLLLSLATAERGDEAGGTRAGNRLLWYCVQPRGYRFCIRQVLWRRPGAHLEGRASLPGCPQVQTLLPPVRDVDSA
jgi:hypothetical protein